jgi:uncharacterized protein (TIGR00295 family)
MTSETANYPSREECLNILNQSGCPENVIKHILVVTEIVLGFLPHFPEADDKLVLAGALLHDIGRANTHGISHAVEGAKIARELKLPEELVLIIERHICAGIPKEDALELGLPEQDYFPETLEEKLVAHADNLVEGNKRCKIERSIEILMDKDQPVVAERVKNLHKELSARAGIDLDEI